MEVSRSRKKGFSLTELIVVMSIIAVLATLVMGAIIIAKRKSTNDQRVAVAQILETALDSFADNNRGNFFWANDFDSSGNGFVQTVSSFLGADPTWPEWVAGRRYLTELPQGLAPTASGFADDSNNKYFYYMAYGGSSQEKALSRSPHYILAVCGAEGNSSGGTLSIDSDKDLKTVTKDDINSCTSVIYFIRK